MQRPIRTRDRRLARTLKVRKFSLGFEAITDYPAALALAQVTKSPEAEAIPPKLAAVEAVLEKASLRLPL